MAGNLTRQLRTQQSSNSSEGVCEGSIELLYDGGVINGEDSGCNVPLAYSAIDLYGTLLRNGPVRENVQFYITDGKAVCAFSSKVLLTDADTLPHP